MMAARKYTEVLLLLLACFYLSDAAVIRVPEDQPNIQAGIEQAQNLDTVLVAPGSYNECVALRGENITLASYFILEGDTSFISQTIIDGTNLDYTLVDIAAEEAHLIGFTLTNADHDERGGAIIIGSETGAMLDHLIIRNNHTTNDGGGIYGWRRCSFKVSNTRIEENHADEKGGGIFIGQATVVMENVIICNNTAETGGGIWCSDSDISLTDVTICNNYANRSGGGIYDHRNSNFTFNSEQLCNIFLNRAAYGYGNDLSKMDGMMHVSVDTFTVIIPTSYHASPPDNFQFNIETGKIEQYDSDLYVAPDGSDENVGTDSLAPLKTLSMALCKIWTTYTNPRTISLAEGVYSPSETGEFFGWDLPDYLTICGASMQGTVLDADSTAGHFQIGDKNSITLKNMTLTGASEGAISCSNTDALLENLMITGNDNTGVRLYDCQPTLKNIIISNNKTITGGGGLLCYDAQPLLDNVSIHHNSADYGGGILLGGSNLQFHESNLSDIYLNSARIGSDLYCNDTAMVHIIVDTFTVKYPTEHHACLIDNFTFNIKNGFTQQETSDLYCDPRGDNSNSGLSSETPLQSLTFALKKIQVDSQMIRTIHLAEGIYSPAKTDEYFPLNIRRNICLEGISRKAAILDAEQTGRLFISTREEVNCRFKNLTLSGGSSHNSNFSRGLGGCIYLSAGEPFFEDVTMCNNETPGSGGGLYIRDNARPIFYRLTISNNSASEGGGIYCTNFNGELKNMTIEENSAFEGSGIYCMSSNALFTNITFNKNSNKGYGGIFHIRTSDPTLMHCCFAENQIAYDGGAIYIDSSSPKLFHITCVDNTSGREGGGIYCYGSSHPVILNSIIRGNLPNEFTFYPYEPQKSVTIAYTNFKGTSDSIVAGDFNTINWLEGNIDADPAFVGGDPFDYALQANSPCIDKGTAQFTWNSQVILDLQPHQYAGEKPDMGAYEYGCISPIPALIEQPLTFTLSQNYPNPFNYITMINYQLSMNSKVELSIYNLLGQKTATLVSERQPAGIYNVSWHADDFASGLYLYRLQAGAYVATRKMLLIK